MLFTPDTWKLLAGIAIFLLGMHFLEKALKSLTGRSFKLFLKKKTSNKPAAIAGGAIVTAVLQSSSVVNLMVLAFAGAGVITMHNALAIMLGSNLGTTVSSWIIVTLGFKLNIESFALPVIGIAGIAMMLVGKDSRWHNWCMFFLGFGFLFFGLSFIRTSIEQTVQQLDLSILNEKPAILFLLVGLLITSLIQSSSATVAIVLSALHVNAISLFAAMAIVLGSEIGTTVKLVLASVKGVAVKKRVALGNLLFNVVNALLIFIFLGPINKLITSVIGIHDNLIALIFFQTLTNLTGIIIFYPFLEIFGRFLEKRFISTDNETAYIHKVKVTDTELAMLALEKEAQHFIYHVCIFSLNAFDCKAGKNNPFSLSPLFEPEKLPGKYEYIKHLHGEVQTYSIRLQNATADKEQQSRIHQLISSFRNSMYAAKNIKDALPDIDQLKKSSNDLKFEFYLRTKKRVGNFIERAIALLGADPIPSNFEQLSSIYSTTQEGYNTTLRELYRESVLKNVNEVEFSTIVNFNREMYTAEKSVVFALKDYLLRGNEEDYFDELPGFIR
ncbi:Na/Pi symporter [Agriterribacter sp.]|uniref:Na/Pi cotransporter family protein n=1 Tax=Agriterribacter sp. TaxID=2821509 RepID=UPI002CA1FEA5|nr:Na/Pi symporter [Agriterribacter sp.]HRO47373.1 Na/Pi symporter [Agriterribacter sp.]HRQ18804.1 Na/Pi symporter [Agriterribacter sp.]